MQDLKRELEKCHQSAAEGYNLALQSVQEMREALVNEKRELKETAYKQDGIKRIKNDKQVKAQLKEIDAFEQQKLAEADNNLHTLHERMNDDFTIVLYGRTMAGKSTLMEILTHGDGASIGKGGQRTTLDVRPYTWNGLKIFDVPGTCSFRGGQDDVLAFKAAKSADMALFLLTDDAPQPEEAHRLMELLKLGIPVLGIVNVKQALSDKDSSKRRIELKSLSKKIEDKARLDEIVRQFQEFARKYDYDFSNIHFVPSHLKAAYLAQPERENDGDLYALSNFTAVERYIVSTVQHNGSFYRKKTFLNSVAGPMQDGIADMYRHSGTTVDVYCTFDDKMGELCAWRNSFLKSTKNHYSDFIDDLKGRLDHEIGQVVDEYYESKDAGEAWRDSVERININGLCQNFISDVSNEATRKMSQLSDELVTDLHYGNTDIALPDISMDDITDWQGIGQLIGGGILLFELSNPIGWTMLVGSWLFGDSKADKIKKQKKKLRGKLRKSRDEIMLQVSGKLSKIIGEEIFDKQIDGFEKSLFAMRDMRKRLAYVQNKSADSINNSYRNLNLQLLLEVLQHTGIDIKLSGVTTARVIGQRLLLFTTSNINAQVVHALQELMQEDVRAITVRDKEYWDDVEADMKASVLHSDFDLNKFLDEDWGTMNVIVFPDIRSISEENIQLMQQLWNSPTRRGVR